MTRRAEIKLGVPLSGLCRHAVLQLLFRVGLGWVSSRTMGKESKPPKETGPKEALRRIRIAETTGTKSLDLSDLGLATLPPEIGSLTALQRLDLGGNQLTTLPPVIGSLTALRRLILIGNQLTTLPPEIGSLTALQKLYLGGNRLTALPPEIGSLISLQVLGLGWRPPALEYTESIDWSLSDNSNMISGLPPEIGSLSALHTLDLGCNRLTAVPREIGLLHSLKILDLRWNNLRTLPREICFLPRLEILILEENQFMALPPEIGSLTALQTLDLDRNLLTTLPPEIGTLTALKSLDLRSNELTTLPPEIGSLTALQRLDVRGNQLTTLPPAIGSLTALQTLYLYSNQLTMLPPEIGSLENLATLFLHDNPGLGLPAEVIGPTWEEVLLRNSTSASPKSILDYYFRTQSGARPLREVKLILVGRGEVGKSTLASVLKGEEFKKGRKTTQGINILTWPIRAKGGDATVRIWDFGGQQIMHGTHQFFLTKRAIYLVMVDGRDDRSQREAEYWLKLVRAFGGDSPVMVVMNRQKDYKFDLDRNVLMTKYGISADHFFPTECSKKSTIMPLEQAILKQVSEILSTEAKFPAEWWKIKTHFEQMKEDHLSDKAYRELCVKYGITATNDQNSLLDRLHDLGTILHFGEDDVLCDLTVLDPEWATDGVYRVVTNVTLREEKKGRLRASTLKEILPVKRWSEASHRRYIIELMKKFDLCFAAEGENDVYIVPDLLPEKTPDLSGWNAKACVVFQYQYPVLPYGIVPRFISKTHKKSEGKPRWRSGVILEQDKCEALIVADYDNNTMNIWVRGAYRDARRGLLTIIRDKFAEIHGRFEELNPQERVGVPLDPTVFVDYRDMILDERNGDKSVRVTIAGERVPVMIDAILTGVESSEERARAAAKATMQIKGRSLPVDPDKERQNMDPLTIISAIAGSLKLVDQFRDMVLKFKSGKTPPPPSGIAKEIDHKIVVEYNGQQQNTVKPSEIRMGEWDTIRYESLYKKITYNWKLFSAIDSELPLKSGKQKAQDEIELDNLKTELCRDFREMVRLSEKTLGISLPDHYSLYEVCGPMS